MVIDKINFLVQFIANQSSEIEVFSPFVKLKNQEEFIWEEKDQNVFDRLKEYLSEPPVLMYLNRVGH